MRPSPVSRRAFLASALSVSLAGCNGIQYRDRYSPGERVSLTITGPPADDDRVAAILSRRLTDRLSALGVDAVFQPEAQSQLYLDALINHDFDVFVGRHPGVGHPDALYPLLHSRFAAEPGWQNPFGVSSVALDDTLEALRASDDPRSALRDVLDAYVERVPFAVIAFPEFLTVRRQLPVSDDAVTERPLDVLGQLADAGLDRPLRAGIFSAEVTTNRNPVAAEFRWNRQILDLVYDSLARPARHASSYVPWAARDWFFDGDELVAELRPGQRWHDGSRLNAMDVAFTVAFLSDTSLGEAESPIPATRFRGRTTLVSSARATDATTVRFDLEPNVSQSAAQRVLTLPILPASEWRDRSAVVDEQVTQALVWENRQPVGSGPLAFDTATEDESVTLRPYADHFLADADDRPAARYAPALRSGGLVAQYAPSGEDALAALADDRLDTSLHTFPLHAFGGAADTDGTVSASAPSDEFYLVGYNTRRSPLSDFGFRQVLARLHDRDHLVASVFEGHATPTDLPVVGDWASTQPSGGSSVGSFPGENGELDVERARALFEDAGYTYDDAGNLYR